ncbi:MAG: ATP-dependent Clp protease adapter ClpS [Nitrospirae bacterium]|nr:ATP-dependent Clp protease adapter ClpS [Nitrospirota bacterium]MCL5423054.1 ATP-dependent Clp protease adapter ClpS [Nitrospirota bacterium]
MSRNGAKTGEELEVRTRREVKSPALYRVLLLNDDYTTMDFVVRILETVFHKPPAEATQIMLNVHKKGMAVCGVFTRDIAETKVSTVHELARGKGYPLMCIMEKE